MSISVVRLDYQDVLWIWCVFLYRIVRCGDDVLINGVWKWRWRTSISGVRRCLRPVYLCELRWHFPRVNKEISRRKAAENLQSLQGYDPSEFTFANGVFCDVKEKLCRDDRYFGVDGKRSGKINQTTTKMLFMCREWCLVYIMFYSSLTSWATERSGALTFMTGRVPVGWHLLNLNIDVIFFSFVFTGVVSGLQHSQLIFARSREWVLSVTIEFWGISG